MQGDLRARMQLLIELWNARDVGPERLAEYFHPSVELESPLASVAGEPYRGYGGIEQWLRDIDEQFEQWSLELTEVRELDGRALLIADATIRGRASELTLRFPAVSIQDFASDGRVSRVRIFATLEEASAALGEPN